MMPSAELVVLQSGAQPNLTAIVDTATLAHGPDVAQRTLSVSREPSR